MNIFKTTKKNKFSNTLFGFSTAAVAAGDGGGGGG